MIGLKHLNELAAQLSKVTIFGDGDQMISSIYSNSQKVKKGSLFIALPGHRVHGRDYVESAIASGASGILTEEKLELPVPQLVVPNIHEAMEKIVPYFYDYPGRKMRMIGVTGTNGKTTTTFLIHHLLQKAGIETGLIGTICNRIGAQEITSENTTPDVTQLQLFLSEMVQAKVTTVVMEVSSHALALNRVAGCEFDVAAFTNLTQDHLDFHGSLEEYKNEKLKLFASVSSGEKGAKRAIVNLDDPAGQEFYEASLVPCWTYGQGDGADFFVKNAEISQWGTRLELRTPDGDRSLYSPLTGDFNIYNVLAAVAVARAEGVEWSVIEGALKDFSGVPGRFEQVSTNKKHPLVVVDYAHSPDGLKNVLETARKLTSQKVISVFGCGGDRDRTKRPLMGGIGADLSDLAIVTSDNPRSEDPEEILKDILTAWEFNGKELPLVEIDRQKAIETAISLAEPGDVVVIAGKGHETYQILKDKTIHFDDREIARDALEAKYGCI